MRRSTKLIFRITLVVSLAALASAQTDLKTVKDHPLISRFPGSDVLEYRTVEFDEFPLALGKIIDENKFTRTLHLEGKVTKFKYNVPNERSAIEISRDY